MGEPANALRDGDGADIERRHRFLGLWGVLFMAVGAAVLIIAAASFG